MEPALLEEDLIDFVERNEEEDEMPNFIHGATQLQII